jgi:hypothetical protein
MARVHTRKKVARTLFRKLPFGCPFWLATNLSTTPFIKRGRTTYLSGWNTTTGAPIETTVSSVNVAVVKVPEIFTGQNEQSE